MLKRFQNSELSRALGGVKLTLENLLGTLMAGVRTGHFTFAKFNGTDIVARFVLDTGRVVRGYGKSLVDAVRSICHQLFVIDAIGRV